jgi:protein-S-isoprenylcysteine O-methyltransferase Ste14
MVFLVGAVWLGVALARMVPGAAITSGRDLAFWLGIVLALAGIALRWYAVITLGRSFTTSVMTRPDQTVIRAGPYRLVRHPSYTGLLLTVLGLVLCSTNWLALACFPLAVVGFAYRIRVEEQALLDGLGQPYRDYMRDTKRLVPFVV